MGSSGGSGSNAYAYYQQQQQLALQREQMALQQKQHEESMALQREALDKPVAAVAKTVGLETEQMVNDQQNERQALRGIRSTYSLFNKANDENNKGTGAAKLGE